MSHKNTKSGAKRRPNFSSDEQEALVQGVVVHYDTLFGQFSAKLSPERKDKLWKDILAKVNAVFNHGEDIPLRTVDEIKKKYQGLKKDVKAKQSSNAHEIKETGGGDADLVELTEQEELILSTIPPVSSNGILDGFDSSASGTSKAPVIPSKSPIIPVAASLRKRKISTEVIRDDEEELPTHEEETSFKRKIKRTKPIGQNIYSLQTKQVELVDLQIIQLTRIGDLMEERNRIEKEKLQLKKIKMGLD